jgi:serine/threonine protein kinase
VGSSQLDEKSIFNIARKIVAREARSDYLKQYCGDDQALHDRVTALLRIHDEEQSFLESPPPGLAATKASAPIAECLGAVIGCYKLLEQIGDGGMGVVYMAEQREPVRRKVALKIIKPGMDTREVIARFEAERQAKLSVGAADSEVGNAVAVSGNTMVVGASDATVGSNTDQGVVYVFTEPASGWTSMTQTAKLTTSDGAAA